MTPILTYHKIAPVPRETLWPGTYVPPWLFAAHLSYLRRRYAFCTVSDLVLRPNIEGRAVLTFDDGTRDFVDTAIPLLDGGAATVYVVTARLGGENEWDAGDVPVRLMDAETVRRIARGGIEIGSHTRTHADLARAHAGDLEEEIVGSQSDLEALLGPGRLTFCYPYGRISPAADSAVRRAGYAAAVTTAKGGNGVGKDPFRLRRIAIRNDTSLPILVYKLWRARRFGR